MACPRFFVWAPYTFFTLGIDKWPAESYNSYKCYNAEADMEGKANYLTLKEAAEQLGVHPNTLRNWERRGVIRLERLPGSRYRRVPVYEVQRLAPESDEKRSEKTAWSAEIRPAESDRSARVIETERVRIELPSDDPGVIAEGRMMAERIKARLAELDLGTLEESMQALRGRAWSS